MSVDLAPFVQYGGIQQVLRASYTLSHGITPGVAEIECAPQAAPIQSSGPLTFSDGQRSVTFQDMRVMYAQASRGPSGLTWRFTLADRRWRWAFGSIYGEYNRRDDGGSQAKDGGDVIGIKKDVKELAYELTYRGMKESVDISEMPVGEVFPWVKWIAANPAHELSSLADMVGCRVVLGLDGTTRLLKLGSGGLLPDSLEITEKSLIIDPPERPGTIEVVGAPIRIQTRLRLEAVGLDMDETIKRIDDLTYKPAEGWKNIGEEMLDIENEDQRELAKSSVYRWYRVTLAGANGVFPQSQSLPKDEGYIVELSRILPLLDELVEFTTDNETKQKVKKPARVLGIYFRNAAGARANSTVDVAYEYKGSWTLDGDRGIVKFSDQVRKLDDDGKLDEAELYLECSFNVRSVSTDHKLHWTYTYRDSGSLVEVVKDETLNFELYKRFDTDQSGIGWEHIDGRPLADLEREALYLAQATLSRYANGPGADATYAGIHPISPDGSIQQVTWSVEDGKPMTKASLNCETSTKILPYNARRAWELSKYTGIRTRQELLAVRRADAADKRMQLHNP